MSIPQFLKDAEAKADATIQGFTENTENEAARSEPPQTDQPGEIPASDTDAASPIQDQKPHVSDETWERRYQILQGKYNAEVPALAEQIRSLKDQLKQRGDNSDVVRSLQQRIDDLTAKLSEQKNAASPSASANPTLAELADEYGVELVNGMYAVVQDAIRAQIDPLKSQVSSVESTVKSVSTATKADKLAAIIAKDGLVFSQMNSDPLFNDWLDEQDVPYLPARREMLNAAYAANDLEKAAAFFASYAKGSSPAPARSASKNDLSDHVKVKSAVGASNAATQQVVWTNVQIKQLGDDLIRGKITKEEYERQERQLFAALA